MYLILACAVQHTDSIVISVDRELTFSKLPVGFIRLELDVFVAQRVQFKVTTLPLSVSVDDRQSTDYTFSTADGYPTLSPSTTPTSPPSSQPSSVPSGQPSSSPTSAPSVSPQPSSQPSTSGPTNTYKPTVKPSQRPSARPSGKPTARPSRSPSISPTLRPSVAPSARPSTKPSTTPSTTKPTLTPSAKPTRDPTIESASTSTITPSLSPTIATTGRIEKERGLYRARESVILGQVVAGLFVLWCLYYSYGWWQYKVREVKVDKKRVREMVLQDLPGKPRYPIFSAVASLCHSMNIEEMEVNIDKEEIEMAVPSTSATPSPRAAAASTTPHTYTGQGAYMDGPASFMDLEANLSGHNNNSHSGSRENSTRRIEGEQLADILTDQLTSGVTGSPEAEGTAAGASQGEVSDLSDASSASEESTDASNNPSDNTASSNSNAERSVHSSSNHSYATAGWYELEPSDDGDVVYTLSSDDDSIASKGSY